MPDLISVKSFCQIIFDYFLPNFIKFSSLSFKNLNFSYSYQGAWSIVNFILLFFTCQIFYLVLHYEYGERKFRRTKVRNKAGKTATGNQNKFTIRKRGDG